jgi:hypothetical protein
LDDVVQFNNFNEIVEFVIDLKDSISSGAKKMQSDLESSGSKKGIGSETSLIPDDAKIDRRTYYYFNGLEEKVLKGKIESLIK